MPQYNTPQRPSKREDGWPTRGDLRYDTDAERLCRILIGIVEAMGASEALTRAVTLIYDAREAIADHVERIERPTDSSASHQLQAALEIIESIRAVRDRALDRAGKRSDALVHVDEIDAAFGGVPDTDNQPQPAGEFVPAHCNCLCHGFAGMHHVIACCYPSQVVAPAGAVVPQPDEQPRCEHDETEPHAFMLRRQRSCELPEGHCPGPAAVEGDR